jgi:hypothetical protein
MLRQTLCHSIRKFCIIFYFLLLRHFTPITVSPTWLVTGTKCQKLKSLGLSTWPLTRPTSISLSVCVTSLAHQFEMWHLADSMEGKSCLTAEDASRVKPVSSVITQLHGRIFCFPVGIQPHATNSTEHVFTHGWKNPLHTINLTITTKRWRCTFTTQKAQKHFLKPHTIC